MRKRIVDAQSPLQPVPVLTCSHSIIVRSPPRAQSQMEGGHLFEGRRKVMGIHKLRPPSMVSWFSLVECSEKSGQSCVVLANGKIEGACAVSRQVVDNAFPGLDGHPQ